MTLLPLDLMESKFKPLQGLYRWRSIEFRLRVCQTRQKKKNYVFEPFKNTASLLEPGPGIDCT